MTIVVKNKYKASLEDTVLGIDITRASIFGNPFRMSNNSIEERSRVCKKYREYLFNCTNNTESKLKKALDILYQRWKKEGKLVLLCVCAPKACHGDIIKSYLEWIQKQDNARAIVT